MTGMTNAVAWVLNDFVNHPRASCRVLDDVPVVLVLAVVVGLGLGLGLGLRVRVRVRVREGVLGMVSWRGISLLSLAPRS